MKKLPPLPEIPQSEQRPPWVEALLRRNAALEELVHEQREVIQVLRDEIAVLKKQKQKPRIRPSQMTKGGEEEATQGAEQGWQAAQGRPIGGGGAGGGP